MSKHTLLMIGNYLAPPKHNRNVWHDLSDKLALAGWKVITTSTKEGQLRRLLDMLITVIKNNKKFDLAQIDVFSGRAFIYAELSSLLLKMLKKPMVLTLHGGNLPKFAIQHPRIIRRFLKRADVVTVPSNFLLEAMQQYREDVILVPNALDISNYPFIHRKKLKPILIWLRAFHEIYNPEMAILVLRLLHEDIPNIRLIMIGPDKGDGSLQYTKKMVTQLGLENVVEFPGTIPKTEVPKWLNEGEIFINTTNFDNTPISVIEAMACGLCIVSTNVGGIPYLLENEVDALLVPPNDPLPMSEAVLRIIKDQGLAEKLSVNARKKTEDFDWNFILPKWVRIFEGIIDKL